MLTATHRRLTRKIYALLKEILIQSALLVELCTTITTFGGTIIKS